LLVVRPFGKLRAHTSVKLPMPRYVLDDPEEDLDEDEDDIDEENEGEDSEGEDDDDEDEEEEETWQVLDPSSKGWAGLDFPL
jgi:hypothetical protein